MGMFVDDGSDSGEDCIVDDVGGTHDEGLGWNPQGYYCGECSKRSCAGCMWEKMDDTRFDPTR